MLILNLIPFDRLLYILFFTLFCAYLTRPKCRKKLLKNDSSHQTCRKRSISSGWRLKEFIKLYNNSDAETITNKFTTLDDVCEGLKKAGLESFNLIFGIDFSISNRYQGLKTFDSRSLHDTTDRPNPYQQVITTLGKTLERFDEDGLIPVFGFGDSHTKDTKTFNFSDDGQPFQGFREVLQSYTKIVARVALSGPTNLAPIIYKALEIVKASKKYHVLVIVSDGQITREHLTMRALVDASSWPLSIVLIGVGDGPWDTMIDYDDSIRGRVFDNFQFVDYYKATSGSTPEATLALYALMEIPEQYAIIRRKGLLKQNFVDI